jgi:hypothetical protein
MAAKRIVLSLAIRMLPGTRILRQTTGFTFLSWMRSRNTL